MPNQLGGEMQRVAIGRALINDPKIILADEPTGNLDSTTSQMIFELFRELNRKGLTMVIVIHNLDLARKVQKMYTLKDGQIVGCEDLAYVLRRDDITVQQESFESMGKRCGRS